MGNTLSPILANIYVNKYQKYMKYTLQIEFGNTLMIFELSQK